MKVILINGSIHEHGCTNEALKIIKDELKVQGVESEIVFIGDKQVEDYNAKPQALDVVDEVGELMKKADGIIVGSPTWYSHPTGNLICFLDRLSMAYSKVLAYKPAASIMTARRAGQVTANDVIQRHFSINNMPIVTSTYWNLVFANKPEEIYQDEEGVNTLKSLARNMAWLIKCINQAKIEHPDNQKIKTNFHH